MPPDMSGVTVTTPKFILFQQQQMQGVLFLLYHSSLANTVIYSLKNDTFYSFIITFIVV